MFETINKKIKDLFTINDLQDALMLATSLGLVVLTVSMALVSDLTYDESYTYLHYVHNRPFGFLKADVANNHPLNSLFIYFSAYFFPFNDLAIRLPSLLFLIVYLGAAISVAKQHPSFKLLVFGLLVFFWPLVPLYFSQARGYGIATAFVLLFIFRFKYYVFSERNMLICFYLLLLASYAFVGLLPLVVAVGLYYLIFHIKGQLLGIIKRHTVHVFVLLTNFSFIIYFLVNISSAGKPIFGGTGITFAKATLGWYIHVFYSNFAQASDTLLLVSILVIAAILLSMSIFKGTKARISFVTLCCFSYPLR